MPTQNDDFEYFDDYLPIDCEGEIQMSAYIKPNIINNEPVWSIYTSDGTVFATTPNKALAEALVSQNDFNLVTLN